MRSNDVGATLHLLTLQRVPTSNERKALWFLAVVALSGSGVRLWRASVSDAGATENGALARQIGRVDSVRGLRHNREALKPRVRVDTVMQDLKPPAERREAVPVDLDQATIDQIESLPGVGPALAKRIVADRDSNGAFGQLEALCVVKGIGSVLAAKLRPLVTFTGARRPLSAACGGASKSTPKTRRLHARQPR